MQMKASRPPEISAFARAFVLGLWVLIFPGLLLFLLSMVLGESFSGPDRAYSWLLVALLLCGGWVLWRQMLAPFFTELGAGGVKYLTLTGRSCIAWAELTAIEIKAQQVTLKAGPRTVRLNLFCYRRPGDLLPFLASVAPNVPFRPVAA
jgi:hypothetical protein